MVQSMWRLARMAYQERSLSDLEFLESPHLHLEFLKSPHLCLAASLTAEHSCQRGYRVAHDNEDKAQLLRVPNDPRFWWWFPTVQQFWTVTSHAILVQLSASLISSDASSFPDTECG